MEDNNMSQPEGSNKNMTPVIIAVVVLLGLAGLVYAMSGKKEDSTLPKDTSMDESTAVDETPSATDEETVIPSETPTDDESITASVTPIASTGATMSGTPTGTMSATKTFEVDAENFSFSVKEINVNKGDTVQIKLINKEGNHDLVIDEFDAKTKVLKAGETETVTFVADKAGTYEYYCNVGNHRAQGMWGKLIIK